MYKLYAFKYTLKGTDDVLYHVETSHEPTTKAVLKRKSTLYLQRFNPEWVHVGKSYFQIQEEVLREEVGDWTLYQMGYTGRNNKQCSQLS